MRYTEYHNGVAVIKDKALLKGAMQKLAKYEDEEENPSKKAMLYALNSYCSDTRCGECIFRDNEYCSFAYMDYEGLKTSYEALQEALNKR